MFDALRELVGRLTGIGGATAPEAVQKALPLAQKLAPVTPAAPVGGQPANPAAHYDWLNTPGRVPGPAPILGPTMFTDTDQPDWTSSPGNFDQNLSQFRGQPDNAFQTPINYAAPVRKIPTAVTPSLKSILLKA